MEILKEEEAKNVSKSNYIIKVGIKIIFIAFLIMIFLIINILIYCLLGFIFRYSSLAVTVFNFNITNIGLFITNLLIS